MKALLYIASLLFFLQSSGQGIDLEQKVTISYEHISMDDLIKEISRLSSTEFLYTSAVVKNIYLSNVIFDAVPLSTVFDEIFTKNNLKWLSFNKKIVLLDDKKKKDIVIRGKIINKEAKYPIENTGVYIADAHSGTISNNRGEFKFIVKQEHLKDSLIFTHMGYKSISYAAKDLARNSYNIIQLDEKVYSLPPVDFIVPKYKKKTLGTKNARPRGAINIDTHGQQVALYIDNENALSGKISTVSYFLSDEGNTKAPFRVRLYYHDTVLNKPGDDLLKEYIIVYPDGEAGWYNVDLRKFGISIPKYGFYIAIEGIFPNEYMLYSAEENDSSTVTIMHPDVISYGQKLGYTKRRDSKDKSWHYSLAKIWFQLRKNEYGAMMHAEILYSKQKQK